MHRPATPPASAGAGVRVRVDAEGEVTVGETELTPVLAVLAELGAVGSPDLQDAAAACGAPAPGSAPAREACAPASDAAASAPSPNAPDRAADLSSDSLAGLDPEQIAELLGAVVSLRAALAAVEARTVVALEDGLRSREQLAGEEAGPDAPEVDDSFVRRRASREASMIAHRSPASSSHRLAASRRLVRQMPHMLAALADGRITEEAAMAVGRAVGPVDPGVRQQIDDALESALPQLEGAGVRQWTREVDALAHAMDPDGATRRNRRARTSRGVTVRPGAHGMADLHVRMPGIDAALVRKRLSLEAERLRAAGDRRGHHQIMCDVLADTLIGRGDGMDPVRLDIGVIITDRALLQPEHGDVASIPGYGSVPFEQIRECLQSALAPPPADGPDPLGPDGPQLRAVFRRLWTHPTTDELVAVESRARALPPALRRFVLYRDMSCRGPYCDAEIRHMDHVRPHADGGPTSLENANGLCASCNGKETFTRSVTVERRVRWTGTLGTSVTVGPVAAAGLLHTHPATADAAEPTATIADAPDPPDPTAPIQHPSHEGRTAAASRATEWTTSRWRRPEHLNVRRRMARSWRASAARGWHPLSAAELILPARHTVRGPLSTPVDLGHSPPVDLGHSCSRAG